MARYNFESELEFMDPNRTSRGAHNVILMDVPRKRQDRRLRSTVCNGKLPQFCSENLVRSLLLGEHGALQLPNRGFYKGVFFEGNLAGLKLKRYLQGINIVRIILSKAIPKFLTQFDMQGI